VPVAILGNRVCVLSSSRLATVNRVVCEKRSFYQWSTPTCSIVMCLLHPERPGSSIRRLGSHTAPPPLPSKSFINRLDNPWRSCGTPRPSRVNVVGQVLRRHTGATFGRVEAIRRSAARSPWFFGLRRERKIERMDILFQVITALSPMFFFFRAQNSNRRGP